MPSYRKCLEELRTWFWGHEAARLVRDKRASKELARSLGVRVPRDIELPPSYVIKPHNGCASRDVVLMHEGRNLRGGPELTVVEEMVVGEGGEIPPLNFRFYVFDRVRMVQVDDGGPNTPERSYFSWPDWEPLRIDRKVRWLPASPPNCGEEVEKTALLLASHLPCPVRVDLYATDEGPVFGEFCVTPGLSRRLTDEGDELLGAWFGRFRPAAR